VKANDGIVSRTGARLGPRLRRYVARALAVPTGIALLGLGVAYLTRSLMQWSDLILNRGLGGGAVATLALYQMVPVLAQVLPFAVLIGVLVGLGHLRATHELLAIETLGVSGRGLWRPVSVFAASVTVLSLLLSLWGAPAARVGQARAIQHMLTGHPGATLAAGAVHEFGDHRLTAREVSSRGDVLRGVVLWSPELGETLFAERAEVTPDASGGIDLLLRDATVLLSPADGGGQIQVGTFRTQLSLIDAAPDPRDRLAIAGFGRLRELARQDPGAEELEGVPLGRLIAAELQRRFALPLAGLILALAAVPLALSGRGATPTAGAVLGLLLTVAYYGLTQLANGLLHDSRIPVALAVWLPNGVLALAAALLLSRRRMSTLVNGVGAGSGRRLWMPSLRVVPGGRFILPRYVAGTFVQLALVCFLALWVGYLLVDVLERLEWFARYESTAFEALRFYGARTPLLMSRVGPLALLAAASLTISLFARRGELVAMQACGVSMLRALAPISAVALVAVPSYFFFSDVVVPHSNALADHLKETEIKGERPGARGPRFAWYRVGGSLLQARSMSPDQGLATDVTIYELDERDFPRSRIDAATARYRGAGEWELSDARRYEISEHGVSKPTVQPRVRLGGGVEELDAMHLGVRGLAREIRRAGASGYDTTAFEVDLQQRLAAPFACLLLPWIAIGAAVSGRAPRSASRNLLLAAVLAVGFDLLGDVSRSLGYGQRLPPTVAAWAPTVLLVVLGAGLARRASR
jgi:lipopolysaccharide export system permease protein